MDHNFSCPLPITFRTTQDSLLDGSPVLDLDYDEDSNAETDANFVITGTGLSVEIQATGEKRGFSRDEFNALFDLAHAGAKELFALQNKALGR